MFSPNPIPRKSLNIETTELIRGFYENEGVSRQQPGKRDFVVLKIEGKQPQVQKKLILSIYKNGYKKK